MYQRTIGTLHDHFSRSAASRGAPLYAARAVQRSRRHFLTKGIVPRSGRSTMVQQKASDSSDADSKTLCQLIDWYVEHVKALEPLRRSKASDMRHIDGVGGAAPARSSSVMPRSGSVTSSKPPAPISTCTHRLRNWPMPRATCTAHGSWPSRSGAKGA